MTDKERIDALEIVGANITTGRVKFEDSTEWELAHYVAGGGCAGGAHRSLREALDSWIETMDFAIGHEPEHHRLWDQYRKVNPA